MLDFNHESALSAQIAVLVDSGLQRQHEAQAPRRYLGASRLGIACIRALQYEFAQAPVDAGRETPGRILRVFARGHRNESEMAEWLRAAGFDLRCTDAQGQQYGFSLLDGQLQGHIDGVIVGGPEGYAYPCLWEHKCLGGKSWRTLLKEGLARAKPVYAAQVAVYQAYLELHQHPALFTAINADTMEIYAERVAFDGNLAQRMSDRAAQVIAATAAGELLPRSFAEASHVECRQCAWQDRCWRTV